MRRGLFVILSGGSQGFREPQPKDPYAREETDSSLGMTSIQIPAQGLVIHLPASPPSPTTDGSNYIVRVSLENSDLDLTKSSATNRKV
jgi:hypothetical protein